MRCAVTCTSDAILTTTHCVPDPGSAREPSGALSGGGRTGKVRCHRSAGWGDRRPSGARSGTAAPGSGAARVSERSPRSDLRSATDRDRAEIRGRAW